MIIMAFLFCVLGLVFSIFFLWYGFVHGIQNKRILGSYPDNYLNGRKAVNRGIFYILIGIFFLSCTTITAISIYKKIKSYQTLAK